MRQRCAFMEDAQGVGLNEYDIDSMRELSSEMRKRGATGEI